MIFVTRIFNKAITQTEVNTLYAETTSTVDTVQILGDTSLKALYKFDGNLNDSSGNNYAPPPIVVYITTITVLHLV